MSFDPITEKIAHFIGSFEMLSDEARMREAYDEFRAFRAAEAETEALALRSSFGKQPHALKDYNPDFKYEAPFESLAFLQKGPELDVLPFDVVADNSGANAVPDQVPLSATASQLPAVSTPFPVDPSPLPSDIPDVGVNLIFNLPLPAALAAVTYQIVRLSDNDIFSDVASQEFQPIAPMVAVLEKLGAFANDLNLIPFSQISTDADWFSVAADISQSATEIETGSYGQISVLIFQGAAAQSSSVQGAEFESFPDWDEIIPAFYSQDLAEAKSAFEGEEVSTSITESHDYSRDFPNDTSTGLNTVAGHEVVAGANTLLNKVSISSSWLDAQVFAVAGNVLRFDAISQVNVLFEHDSVFGKSASSGVDADISKAINAASISEMSREEGRLAAENDPSKNPDAQTPEEVIAAYGGGPTNVVLVRYEGDLEQFNWVKQYTFSTDMDQAVLSFGGASTFLGLGENAITNSFTTQQLGYGYDLIVVGGDMINLNLINQRNVVLDSDTVTVNTQPNGTEQTDVETADVALQLPVFVEGTAIDGPAESHADEPVVFDVALSEPVQPVAPSSETLDQSQRPEQGFDAPELLTSFDETLDADAHDSGPVAASGSISTADNLLYNEASIDKIGADTDAQISENFLQAINDLSGGATDVSDDVVQEEAFNGIEFLRVLYIDGDFTTINVLDQTNILGDSDQVHIARDDFAAALQDQIQITTGSNIAANFAAIRDNGFDSTVMAQGTTYSDALIHQANLIDSSAAPTSGMEIAALANEAVAFLADGLIDPNLAEGIVTNANNLVLDAMNQTDGMEAILT